MFIYQTRKSISWYVRTVDVNTTYYFWNIFAHLGMLRQKWRRFLLFFFDVDIYIFRSFMPPSNTLWSYFTFSIAKFTILFISWSKILYFIQYPKTYTTYSNSRLYRLSIYKMQFFSSLWFVSILLYTLCLVFQTWTQQSPIFSPT